MIPRMKKIMMRRKNIKGRPKSSKKFTILVALFALLFFHPTVLISIGTGISWS